MKPASLDRNLSFVILSLICGHLTFQRLFMLLPAYDLNVSLYTYIFTKILLLPTENEVAGR